MSDSASNSAQKANLARIRDNQRRSRARRKEYLQELETKYRNCEAVGVEASAEIQAAARKVLDENKRLRQLLKQQGLSDADIDGFDDDHTRSVSPSNLKTDGSESPQLANAATALNSMLATRKTCRAGSGCSTDEPLSSRRISGTPSNATPQNFEQHSNIAPRMQQINASTPTSSMQPSPQVRSQSVVSSHTNQQYHNTPQTNMYGNFNMQPQQGYSYQMSMDPMDQMGWGIPGNQDMHPQQMNQMNQYGQHQMMASNQYADPNTSSCFVAADAIRSYSANAGPELEQALGCRDGSECNVRNEVVFELMDRYSAHG